MRRIITVKAHDPWKCPNCGDSSMVRLNGAYYICDSCGYKWLDEGPDY